jgi:sugar phosphate isomerase/epimerase
VNHPSVVVHYDAGNTWGYTSVDANIDFKKCAAMTRGFAIKDFRQHGGKRVVCGPGYGQTDHFAMLGAVVNNGGRIPLCCETVSEPFGPRLDSAEAVETLARRSREFLATVVQGVTAAATA